MAKITKSLIKNSESIGGIQKTIASFGQSLRAANNTSSVIIREFTKSNRSKKRAMLKQREIFGKRRSAVQRREREDLVESGKVNGIFRRTTKVISTSTKGFLGRIMDFLGTILVGWIVTNLPVIIKNVEKLIGRIQETVSALTGWYDGITGFFARFTGELNDTDQRLSRQADFTGETKQANETKENIEKASRNLELDYNRMIDNVNNFDLYALLGLKGEEKQKKQENSGATPTNNQTTLADQEPQPEQKKEDVNPFTRFFGGLADFVMRDTTDFDKQGDSSYSGGGGKLSPEQIADVARRAGISEDMIPTMVAIALAESGGDSGIDTVKSGLDPDKKNEFSLGLWQINMIDRPGFMLGEERRRKLGISKTEQLYDPLTNARAAALILREQGLGAWSVYTNGRYKQYLPTAKKAFSGPRTSQPVVSKSVDSGTRYSKGQDVTQLLGGQSSATITSRKGDFESFRSKPHGGIDIGCSAGLFISLTVDAEVVGTANQPNGYGNVIDVWISSMGVQLRFAHNSRILIPSGKIPAGTSFAITGSTGRSTGPHIHLEASSERGSMNYGGNMVPAPYVALIRLTKASIEGQKASLPGMNDATGGPSLQIDGTGNRTMVASNVTPERRGSVITVPIPTESGQQPSSDGGGGGGGGSSSGNTEGTSLNSFIHKILLRDLEYV